MSTRFSVARFTCAKGTTFECKDAVLVEDWPDGIRNEGDVIAIDGNIQFAYVYVAVPAMTDAAFAEKIHQVEGLEWERLALAAYDQEYGPVNYRDRSELP